MYHPFQLQREEVEEEEVEEEEVEEEEVEDETQTRTRTDVHENKRVYPVRP